MSGGQRLIRIADSLVNLLMVLFFVPLLLYGGYALWDAGQVYEKTDLSVYQTYRPDTSHEECFSQLQKVNPEVFGWLTVEGTEINYPLVQAQDNFKYVNTDVKGNFSLAGSIFLDYRNSTSFTDVNHVIYGHHIQEDAMFGALSRFAEKDYFASHPRGEIFCGGAWHDLDFFAFVQADAYDPVLFNAALQGPEDSRAYYAYVKENAQNFREIPVNGSERYVGLSTCTSTATNGRYILVGRIVDE